MKKTCSFISYEKVNNTKILSDKLEWFIDLLINYGFVENFIFIKNNEFSQICYEKVNKLSKEKHPLIKKVFYDNVLEVVEKSDSIIFYCNEEKLDKGGLTANLFNCSQSIGKRVFIYGDKDSI